MKILFITNNLPPIVDGVGDYTYNIAKQFAKHEHEVYIVCRKDLRINIEIEGIMVLPIVENWNFRCYKPIVKVIKENRIDIVSLQYVPHGFHLKGLPFSIVKLTNEINKTQSKLFTFFHEVYVEEGKGRLKRYVLSKLMQSISKRVKDNSDYLATSIEYYGDMIKKLSSRKKDISIIPIASNIPETKMSEDDLAVLKKEIAPNNETIISFFGLRNIQTSIDAISELKNDGYNLKIVLIGKTQCSSVNNLPKDTFKTGILDIVEIDKYFKISDIFILPQDNIYGCSFKSGSFVAGMRNRLPIITAKGKLTSNELKNCKNILFTDFDCIKEIKESVRCLLKNRNLVLCMRKQAYIIVGSFTWEETYNRYIHILSRVK